MKTKATKRGDLHALTLTEVLVVIAVSLLLAVLLLPAFVPGHTGRIRPNCASNLKQVGLAFRLWAADNNDKFPVQVSITNGGTMELAPRGSAFIHFLAMPNELNTPRILVCPTDKSRVAATNWNELRNANVSYFVGLDPDETTPQILLSGDSNFEVDGKPISSGILTLWTNSTVGWTTARHKRCGNILLSDGSVQQHSNPGLQRALKETGTATNRLAIP